MLAGEKGIWGSLQPLLEKMVLRVTGKTAERGGSGQ
jgi:hypothetical protein